MDASEAKEEYWDLYNQRDQFVRTMKRGEGFVPPYLYHNTVEVIPTDFAGHMLITQRSAAKRRGAGKWEFPAGSVLSGEKIQNAAKRELWEETGLGATKITRIQVRRIPGMQRSIYFAYIPSLLTARIRLQEGETQAYKIITVPQWLTMIASNEFDAERVRLYDTSLFDAAVKQVGITMEPAPKNSAPKKKQTASFPAAKK